MNENDLGKSSPIDEETMDTLLENVTPVQPPEHLRAKVMSKLNQVEPSTFTITVEEGWITLESGIDFKMLFVDEATQTKSFLLRVAAGMSMPAHAHHDVEECLVLEGDFFLGDIHLTAGDYHCAFKGSVHGDSRTDNGVLVYLKSSIKEYPDIHA
jgi:anti-sigma factor ChrR (cupin superfamily)